MFSLPLYIYEPVETISELARLLFLLMGSEYFSRYPANILKLLENKLIVIYLYCTYVFVLPTESNYYNKHNTFKCVCTIFHENLHMYVTYMDADKCVLHIRIDWLHIRTPASTSQVQTASSTYM